MNANSVLLRPTTESDHDMLFSIAADLDTWEERSPAIPGAMTRARFDARQATADSDETAGDIRFIIEVEGDAVGSVSLFGFETLTRHAEIGIALTPEARGRGIGTAAISQMVEFGFIRDNLRRIHLEVIGSNGAAIRSYEKAGFVIEGRQREHAWVRGAYEDIVRMGILRAEWRASRA